MEKTNMFNRGSQRYSVRKAVRAMQNRNGNMREYIYIYKYTLINVPNHMLIGLQPALSKLGPSISLPMAFTYIFDDQ
jgi:hypothetical protein